MRPCTPHSSSIPPVLLHALRHYTRSSSTPAKRPSRGGQNLTDRYRRLETSSRAKSVLSNGIEALESSSHSITNSTSQKPSANRLKKDVHTFRGMIVPQKPRPPQPGECCMSACAVCVDDLYAESLDAYQASVLSLQQSLVALKVPESEWPLSIRRPTSSSSTSTSQQQSAVKQDAKSVSLNAFEAMELALKAKRDGELRNTNRDDPFPTYRKPRKTAPLPDVKSLYEGILWFIFSNR